MLNIVAYGGGTNSTALLVGMYEKGIRPDLILCADTGDERPKFYDYVKIASDWCVSIGFPEIITVKKGGREETLGENCLRMNMLPSIAYGYKGCSHKYKKQPQEKFTNNWEPAKLAWKRGEKVVKIIGYDADEERRAVIKNDEKYEYKYLLIDWGWAREECVEAISRAGLPQPGKSACSFCPSNTREEIEQLKAEYPILFQKALIMERNAESNLDTVAGLGRRFSWHEHAEGEDAAQFVLRANARYAAGRVKSLEKKRQESAIESPCDCYDGA